MFDKRKDSSPPAESTSFSAPSRTEAPADVYNTRNTAVIGSTIKIKGEVSGDENLIIEGSVEGSVALSGHDLTIGQKGQVKADLNAKTVKVDGSVTGDITGAEKVIITKSGKVLGNIVAPRVTLEDGAKFKGSIDMDPGESATSTSTTPKRAVGATKPEPVEEKKQSQTGG
jgi:cytoskeletal protein CcmA (bactofilin family)